MDVNEEIIEEEGVIAPDPDWIAEQADLLLLEDGLEAA